MNVKQFASVTKRGLVKHSPAIMLGLGIAGMLLTVVTAVKATPKAVKLIENKKQELEVDSLTPVETVKTTWKCYISPAVICVASITCLIYGNSVSAKRNAALAGAVALSENAFRDYKNAVAKNVSEEVRDKISDTVVKEQLERAPSIDKSEVTILEKDGELFLDPLSGRYFKSTVDLINRAVNTINHKMLCDGFSGSASLNEFYDEIGLQHISIGDNIGWDTSSGMMDISFGGNLTKDGKPCIVLKYNKPPEYNFG